MEINLVLKRYCIKYFIQQQLYKFQVPTEGLTGNLRLVCSSDDALSDVMDLHPAVAEDPDFIDFVAGKYLPDGGMSVCHR